MIACLVSSGVVNLAELMTEERLGVFLSAFQELGQQDGPDKQGFSYASFASLLSRTMGLPKTSQRITVLCKKVSSHLSVTVKLFGDQCNASFRSTLLGRE